MISARVLTGGGTAVRAARFGRADACGRARGGAKRTGIGEAYRSGGGR